MKKKKAFIIIAIAALVCICAAAVYYIYNSSLPGTVKVKEVQADARIAQNSVLKFISKDKLYDRKSVVWDGNGAQVVYDELDSRSVLDGRYGPFEAVRLETALGAALMGIKTNNNDGLFSADTIPEVDDSSEYRLEISNRYLSLKKSDGSGYTTQAEALSADTGLMELDGTAFKSETEYRLFTGIIGTESGSDMIGFRLLSKGSDGSIYCLTYAGLGNYSDIKTEADEVIRSLLK